MMVRKLTKSLIHIVTVASIILFAGCNNGSSGSSVNNTNINQNASALASLEAKPFVTNIQHNDLQVNLDDDEKYISDDFGTESTPVAFVVNKGLSLN